MNINNRVTTRRSSLTTSTRYTETKKRKKERKKERKNLGRRRLIRKKTCTYKSGTFFYQISAKVKRNLFSNKNTWLWKEKKRNKKKKDSDENKPKSDNMRKALISCIYDPYKSPKRPPTRNYSLILKISIICLLFFFWFILETHKSVDVTAHKYLGKKDVRSFWREHNALNSFQEENPLLKNEKLKGCGSGLEICPGNRPRSTENCKCRAQAWEECGYNIGKECDNQLGLQCTNTTCVGK